MAGTKQKEIKKQLIKQKLKKKSVDTDSDDSDEYETLSSSSEDEEEDEDEESDSTYKPPKSKKNKKNSKNMKKGKYADSSDSDDESEDEEVDRAELQKIISKIFPSKYASKRAKNTEKSKKRLKDIDNKKKYNTRSHKKKKRYEESSEEEDEDEDDYYEEDEEEESEESEEDDSDDEEYEEDEDEDEEQGVYNIVLLGGGEEDDQEYIEDNADCDSDDEKMFMKENFEKDSSTIEEDTNKKSKKKKKKSEEEETEIELNDVEQEYIDLVETRKTLTTQFKKKPKNKVLKRSIDDCNKSILKLIKKARNKNAKIYHKLIHNDKKKANEIDFFKKKLSNKEQLRVMQDLKEINKHINIQKPYRLALLDTNIPPSFKAVAMQRLNILRTMEPGDPEYYKIKNWVDTFMRIPFGIYRNLSVHIDDGIDVCHDFMENAKNTLDNCVYGLNDAKLQIMQMMGQWISNPSAMGTAIAIKGPMGTGKTTLVKEGISKILGREFAFIALGGNSDSSFLEGHSYTYEGSTWGKIVQIIIDSKCMNPVIYFDELDKISDTPKGEEIIGILTHLTDTTQNNQFHDKYFSEVEFDLSKCLFIFSYNDESKVNPILKDRMYRIQTKGYETKEKITIARNHLLPKIREQVNFKEEDIIIPDETLRYIASTEHITKKEDGVRNLKRCLEIIYTKLNLFRLVKSESKIFEKDMEIEVSFPITITQKHVDAFIKNEDKANQSMLAMYI